MPWSGTGNFNRLYSWVNDKNSGINITASRTDADTNDIVAGLENCQTIDGQTIPVHSLPMGGFTHTGVGNATARTNYAAAGQVSDGALLWGGTSGGSANAQTITITPAVTALVAGQSFRFLAGFTNTSAATLTVNAATPAAFRVRSGAGPVALTGGEIIVGNTYDTTFDGTYFVLGETLQPWSTGDTKITLKTVADSGWVLFDDGTMGNAASGGTTRANADTSNLFALLWNNTTNGNCAVSGGRGANAAADFAANKTIALPKVLGRALAVAGAGSGLTSRALAFVVGEETHLLTIPEMPGHTHTIQSANVTTGSDSQVVSAAATGAPNNTPPAPLSTTPRLERPLKNTR